MNIEIWRGKRRPTSLPDDAQCVLCGRRISHHIPVVMTDVFLLGVRTTWPMHIECLTQKIERDVKDTLIKPLSDSH